MVGKKIFVRHFEEEQWMKKDSVKYLKKVLAEWQAFCKTHTLFASAITDLMEEVSKENITCPECIHRHKSSCPLCYGEVNGMRFFTPYAKNDDFSCKVGEPKCQQ